jgi:tripeptide aminopeptidase
MNTTTETFLQLVQIDSPSGNEGAISAYLQSWLKKNKFAFKIDKVGNIYASNNKKGKPILFCAHMDTVQPGTNIHPIIKNGVVKSDGATILGADNKAALAAIMAAVEKNNNRHLELLFTVKEETGDGIDFFPFNWIQSEVALIMDSSHPVGGIVLGSPSIYNFDIQFIGKAAHSSTPENGINSFSPAFQALSELKIGNLDGGETTINIGLINGGTGINTVPNSVHIQGEVRSYDKKLFEKHLNHIEATMKKYAKKSGTKLKFKLNGYCAGYVHKKNDGVIATLSSLFKSMKLKTEYYSHSGISDANTLNAQGIKTYNLTDGTKNTHTVDEQISIVDLNSLYKIVIQCINTL